MNLIRGFVTNPKILFLDEPTLGLDVQVSIEVRGFLREWMAEDPKRTVFLTTHNMAEAEELCDRVAIIDRGRIVACDTPGALARSIGGDGFFSLKVSPIPVSTEFLLPVRGLSGAQIVKRDKKLDTAEIRFVLAEDAAIPDVFARCRERGFNVEHFGKRERSLEDLFLRVVGRDLADDE